MLHFRLPDGSIQSVSTAGSVYTVLQAALRAGVPGIVGQCGGNRACATCHVHIAESWRVIVGPACAEERDLIGLTDDPRPESRLACQIRITPALDGLELTPVG